MGGPGMEYQGGTSIFQLNPSSYMTPGPTPQQPPGGLGREDFGRNPGLSARPPIENSLVQPQGQPTNFGQPGGFDLNGGLQQANAGSFLAQRQMGGVGQNGGVVGSSSSGLTAEGSPPQTSQQRQAMTSNEDSRQSGDDVYNNIAQRFANDSTAPDGETNWIAWLSSPENSSKKDDKQAQQAVLDKIWELYTSGKISHNEMEALYERWRTRIDKPHYDVRKSKTYDVMMQELRSDNTYGPEDEYGNQEVIDGSKQNPYGNTPQGSGQNQSGYESSAEIDKALGWPEGAAERLMANGNSFIRRGGELYIRDSNGDEYAVADANNLPGFVKEALNSLGAGDQTFDELMAMFGDVPQLNQGAIDDQKAALAAKVAQETSAAQRAQMERASMGGFAPEQTSALSAQLQQQGGIETAMRQSELQMQAEVQNLQAKMAEYENRAKAAFAAMQNATSREEREAMQQFAIQMQQRSVAAQQALIQYQTRMQIQLADNIGDRDKLALAIEGAKAVGQTVASIFST